MELSAIISEEELVYEGEGEARNAIGSVGQVRHPQDPLLSRLIHSDTDASSCSLDEMDSSSDIGIDAVTCPKPMCCSSPISLLHSRGSMLESSRLPSREPSGFEGQGGDISVVDPIMLQNEIAELKFQNRKLTDEVADLQRQIATADDAQISLLNQKEDLEKRLTLVKGQSEKIKQLARELEDAKWNLSKHEDKNLIQSKRVQRLEKDNAALTKQSEELQKEVTSLTSEIERYRLLLSKTIQETDEFKLVSEEKIEELTLNKADLGEKLKVTNDLVTLLSATVEQLQKEKRELENNLSDNYENYDSKLSYLEASTSTDEVAYGEEEDLISFRASSCTPVQNSIHAEIAASLRRDSSVLLPQFRHDSLMRYDTSGSSLAWDLESSPDFSHRMRSILSEIWEEVQLCRSELMPCSSGTEEKELEDVFPAVDAVDPQVKTSTPFHETDTVEQVAAVVGYSQGPEATPKDVDVVRRIHEELAEFRVQLKKSQELFHAFNTGQSFSLTKSCPLLADDSDTVDANTNVLKSQLVTCSTQTDIPVIATSSQTQSTEVSGLSDDNPERIDDIDTLSCFIDKLSLKDNELDTLSLDDDSYRLTINLPTVLEESEHETETSPAAVPRRMSSDKSNRPRLIRINATEEPARSDNEAGQSDLEYFSIPSSQSSSKNTSTYNSLERPLQISSGGGNTFEEAHDGESVLSDEHTTYESPGTSPSSPSNYWTPSQGSSSQETITNIDGDKTPVNEQDYYRNDISSCPPDFCESNDSNSLRKRAKPIDKLYLPIDHRSDSFSKGIIPEPDKANYTRFAYDAIQRSTYVDAAILPRDEWRTLNRDLREREQYEYYKGMAQEEGGEGDMQDGGPMRSGITQCLDDEAEEYAYETFPDVVESLFSSLDTIKLKGRDFKLSAAEVQKISLRFNKLSNVFKVDHDALPHREKQSNKDLEIAQNRISEIITALKSSIEKMKDSQTTSDLQEVLHSMEQSSQELQHHSKMLTKKAKEVGSIDLQKRVYKMIEVMVLYVHILRNYENPDKEPVLAKKPAHADNNLQSPTKNSNGTIPSNNNNNNDKGGWTEGYLGEGQRMERWIGESYEFLRRELSWPWNWDQTWKGVKQGFSILLMLAGLLIIFRSVFPIVSANSSKCDQPTSSVGSILSRHSSLIHEERPTL